jgi:hypothetical protein
MSINSDAALTSYCTMHKFIFVIEVYKGLKGGRAKGKRQTGVKLDISQGHY